MRVGHDKHLPLKSAAGMRSHDHACLIYDSDEERLNFIVPYLLAGLRRKECCAYVVDSGRLDQLASTLSARDERLGEAISRGTLRLASSQDICLEDQIISLEKLFRNFQIFYDQAINEGFTALRVAGEVSFASFRNADPNLLGDYVRSLSDFFGKHNALGVCQYSRRDFPPENLLQVIHSHPLLIRDGVICRNFYYVPPASIALPKQTDRLADLLLDNLVRHETREMELFASRTELQNSNRRLQLEIAERQKAEEALRENLTLFRVITDSVPACMAYVDRNCRYQFVNRQYEQYLKVSAESMIGRDIVENLGEEYLSRVQPFVDQALAGRRADFEIAAPVRWGEGGHYISVTYIPDIAANGNVAGFFTFLQDVTEKKKATEALEAIEVRFRQMLEDLQLIAVILDEEGNISFCNRHTLELTGWELRDVQGRNWFDYFIPPEWSFIKKQYLDMFSNGDFSFPLHFVNPIKTRAGEQLTIEWKSTFPRDINGKVIGVASIGNDITLKQRIEESLRESEKKYRLLFDNNPMPMWVYDLDTLAFLEVNEAAVRHYGYSRRRFLAMTIKDIRPPEEIPKLRKQVSSLPPGISKSGVWRHRKRDGTIIMVEVTSHSIEFAGRSAKLVLANDISDRIQAEQEVCLLQAELEHRVSQRTSQLEASNRELEGFCYSVSHDLRAPLTRLEGFSQALLEDNAGQLDDQGKHYAERICNASRQLRQLIDALLDLSQLTRSKIVLQEMDLSKLAWQIAEDLQRQQQERQVKFIIALNVLVTGDPRLLRVVLENLMGNAWKFTSRHVSGVIEFGVAEKNGEKAYFIRDNGAGFDMNYASKLFQPFQRLHSHEEFAGTGIGLATVQRIIQRHGGRIWAEGEVEKGAVFYFTL